MSTSIANFYITGGTLQRDAACYVERQADSMLFDGLLKGKFCYVLTSRQMGKSSLMVRTAVRLREEGIAVAVLDLTAIGQNLNPEQWYNGLLNQIGQRLDLEDELDDFAYVHKQLGPLQRWMRAIREVVLTRCKGRIVIFVDEIDAVRSLPFSTDEFFAGIRELYNSRTEDPKLERLTFCLLGVATPSDLIRDTRTTPFNIGQRIELNDFTPVEATSLAKGLMREERVTAELLKRILYWTSGHPYLTQRLCRAAAEDFSVRDAKGIDRLCEEIFFSHRAQERDDNLLFVRERMLRSEVDIAGLLDLYRKVHKGKQVRDDVTSQLVSILRLSGIVRLENGCLRTRNRIYQRVFDEEWVKVNMPDAELRRQRRAFWRGLLATSSVSIVILAIVGTLAFIATDRGKKVEQERLAKSRLLYVAQMNLAFQAWEAGNIERLLYILESQKPQPGQEDLRGFEWHYLWRLCHSELFTIKHNKPVGGISFSPDGKVLVICGTHGDVKLWDMAAGKELSISQVQGETSFSVAFSPDGKMLALGKKRVKLWDMAKQREIATLPEQRDHLFFLAFSPDNKILATSSMGIVKLWDMATLQELDALNGRNGGVMPVAFSPDGRLLIAGDGKDLILWNTSTRRELATLKVRTNRNLILSVTFSPDGKMLAAGSYDGTVKLWNVATRQMIATLAHKSEVTSVAFSPDGRSLATGSGDTTVKLWDLSTQLELAIFKGHTDRVRSVAFSPDGRFLATGSEDTTVKLWDMAKKQEPLIFNKSDSHAYSLTFSPDGKTLATGGLDTVKLWDVFTGQEQIALKDNKVLGPVWSLAFSPDGRVLAAGGLNGIKLWDISTRQELATLGGKNDLVWSVAFSPDGRILATGAESGTIRLWDIDALKELRMFKGHDNGIHSVAFSIDGKVLATGSSDSTVKLWGVSTLQELALLKGHTGLVRSVVFIPGYLKLATAGEDGTVRLWSVPNGQELATIKGHSDLILSFAVSPDAQARSIDMREKATRSDLILSLAVSPDGQRLATGSGDHSIKMWDVNTGQELATLKHVDKAISVAFSPDGMALAAGSLDTRIWSCRQ